jgi:hypothetical protein
MNIIILLIICVAMAAQIIGAADKQILLEIPRDGKFFKETALFIFQSDQNPDQLYNKQTLEKMANKKLQDRSCKQYIASTKHPILLQDNYQWEKIGKESSDEFKRTLRGNGCIKWHQLPIDNKKEESFSNDSTEKPLITLESIRNAQRKVAAVSAARRNAYRMAQAEEAKLYFQETMGIISPIAALTASKKEQTNCRAYLTNIEESEKTMLSAISRLKKVLPLDLLQLLSNNPEIKTNLFSLLQIQEQQESIDREKLQEQTRLEELLKKAKEEITLLQDGIINFDRSALSDEQLRQKARLAKIREKLDENPELDVNGIQLTDDEYATFVFNYRKTLVLGNIVGEEELATIQSACPKILTPMTSRTIVAKFDETISKPSAQKESSDTEDEEDLEEVSSDPLAHPQNQSSSSSSSSSSSNGIFGSWW